MGFSVYPDGIDGSTELPVSSDNVTPVKAEVVNRLRDAIINTESELGIQPSGTYTTVRARLDALEALIASIAEGGGSISAILQNSTVVRTNVTSINFTGPGVTASLSATPGRVDVAITGGSGTTLFQIQETLPTTNGQTLFTLSETPQDSAAVEMFVNGIKQDYGTDYTASGATVTYTGVSLISSDIVEFWYITSASSTVGQIQENIAISINGQTSITLGSTPVDPIAVKMYVNGNKQDYGTDYIVSGTTVTWISSDFSLQTTDIVEFWYIISGVSPVTPSSGLEVVDDVAALKLVSVSPSDDGKIVYMLSVKDAWVYHTTSSLTADDITVVEANSGSGPGNWERLNFGSVEWRERDTWYIDAVGGNDEDTGLTSLTPLKTFAEITRRWGPDPNIPNLTNINILSDLPLTDLINITNAYAPSMIIFNGYRTTLASGTLTSYLPSVIESNLAQIEDTVLGGYAPYIGRRIRFTSGLANGMVAWIQRDDGTNKATISTPTDLFSSSNPTAGDTYVIEDLGNITIGSISVHRENIVAFNDLFVNGNVTNVTNMIMLGCDLSTATIRNGNNISLTGCLSFSEVYTSLMYISRCASFNTISVLSSTIDVYNDSSAIESGFMYLSNSIVRLYGTICVQDAPTAAAFTVDSNSTLEVYDIIWGSNVEIGFNVINGGAIKTKITSESSFPIPEELLKITTITANASIDGITKSYAELPYMSRYSGSTIDMWGMYESELLDIISAPIITSNKNDYNLDSMSFPDPQWVRAETVLLTSSAAFDITGFAGLTYDVNRKNLVNAGSFAITLKYENASSTAENRIRTQGGVDLVLQPDDIVTIWYDTSIARWRSDISDSGSGGGILSFVDIAMMTATTGLTNGDLAYVETLKDFFVYDGYSSNVSPDGITVTTSGEDGYWLRLVVGSIDWRNQDTWYIDPISGNDEAVGDSLAPIQTWAELVRRWGPDPVFTQSETLVYVVGNGSLGHISLPRVSDSGLTHTLRVLSVASAPTGTPYGITTVVNRNAPTELDGIEVDVTSVGATATGPNILDGTVPDFVALGVTTSDVVVVTGGANAGTYTITNVTSTTLTCSPNWPTPGIGVSYRVQRTYAPGDLLYCPDVGTYGAYAWVNNVTGGGGTPQRLHLSRWVEQYPSVVYATSPSVSDTVFRIPAADLPEVILGNGGSNARVVLRGLLVRSPADDSSGIRDAALLRLDACNTSAALRVYDSNCRLHGCLHTKPISIYAGTLQSVGGLLLNNSDPETMMSVYGSLAEKVDSLTVNHALGPIFTSLLSYSELEDLAVAVSGAIPLALIGGSLRLATSAVWPVGAITPAACAYVYDGGSLLLLDDPANVWLGSYTTPTVQVGTQVVPLSELPYSDPMSGACVQYSSQVGSQLNIVSGGLPGPSTNNDYLIGTAYQWRTVSTIVLSQTGGATGDSVITGMVAAPDSVKVRNFIVPRTSDPNYFIVLAHENAGSAAANRFNCPGNVDVLLGPGDQVQLVYVTDVEDRWFVLPCNLPPKAISPAQITANQNDYSPTLFLGAQTIRIDSDASRDITGFAAPPTAQTKTLINVGSNPIVLKHQNAGSSAANRIIVQGGGDLTMQPDDAVTIFYDITTDRWRIV
jgi:hypothetical protein